jgi:hypothetical protein
MREHTWSRWKLRDHFYTMNIQFIFSNQYEAVIGRKPVTSIKGRESARVMTAAWDKYGSKIEKVLQEITNLIFKEDIKCYLNSRTSFSDPLSLKISNEATMLDNLTHELIHVLLTQNIETIRPVIEKFHDEFKAYPFVTRIHILVHAIHLKVAQKVVPDRIRAIRRYAKSETYRRSWKIVDEIGAQVIIDRVVYY